MTTTAHPPFNLENTATDAMDLHSETELDFDDGDIELDLDSAPPVQRDYDDVSIEDATTDAMLELQNVPADHDDFMLDDVDLIGEDDLQLGDETVSASLQSSATVAMLERVPSPVEEDLIDYSDDDEDTPPTGTQNEQTDAKPTEVHDADEEHLDLQTEQAQQDASTSSLFDGNNAEDDEHVEEENEHNLNIDYLFGKDQNTIIGGSTQGSSQPDLEDGGVQLEGPEGLLNDSDHEPDNHEEQQSNHTRTVTVNYEGNELWLLKQHDTEESGDWLLEDAQVLQSSLSTLFQACRASLGEDISDETELGLRFDHFHNMEIFEDSTACVAVSLERLVDLYYVLNAQDGNDDAESFYMCLLSRPRFAALLSDVAKHADQVSGYSGLNAAISAGETHFVDTLSGHSTEHDATDWENENVAVEEDQEGSETNNEAGPVAEFAEHDGQDDNKSGARNEALEVNTRQEYDNAVSGEVEDHLTIPEAIEYEERPASDEDVSPNADEVQLENDTVDYSDADEQDDEDAPQISTSIAPSPSSTTVQGDHPVAGEDTPRVVADSSNETPISAENDLESHQDYVEPLDEEEVSQELQADVPETYPTEPDFDGFTNQDDTGYDYQNLDQQFPEDFLDGPDLNGTGADESTLVANDLGDGDDFLDLDNASEWVTDQEPTSKVFDNETFLHDEFTLEYEEEEDGVAKQPAVAASTAADPVAASSLNLQQISPQGQKRSIDEVGDSAGDALDFSDIKRPRM